MTLFKYLQDRIRSRRGKVPAAFNSATARCEAAYPSRVITRGAPCCLVAREKNRLAAATSRLLLKRKSVVRPSLSTARQRYPLAAHLEISLIHSPRIAHRPRIMVPAFLNVRHVALHESARWSCGPTRCRVPPS